MRHPPHLDSDLPHASHIRPHQCWDRLKEEITTNPDIRDRHPHSTNPLAYTWEIRHWGFDYPVLGSLTIAPLGPARAEPAGPKENKKCPDKGD